MRRDGCEWRWTAAGSRCKCSATALAAPTDTPFVRASLDTLELVLSDLIESGPVALAQTGRLNRAWLEANWDFSDQWSRFWQPVIDRAISIAGRTRRASMRSGEHCTSQGSGEQRGATALNNDHLPRGRCNMWPNLASQRRCSASNKTTPLKDGVSAVIPFWGPKPTGPPGGDVGRTASIGRSRSDYCRGGGR